MLGLKRTFNLPEPSENEIKKSLSLIDKISDKFPMSFKEFMGYCLYYPELGYYTSDSKTFGMLGDFITAPEVSKIFSYCIAEFIIKNKMVDIIEIGAGTGQMAKTIISYLNANHYSFNSYNIVEISDSLIEIQKKNLVNCRVKWVEEIPNNFSGILIGNELLDAMPIDRFLIKNNKIYKQYVNLEERLVYSYQEEFNERILSIKEKHLKDVDNYFIEINTNAENFMEKIDKKIKSGLVLLIDYGFLEKEFFLASRNTGTLMCHYKHLVSPDPLVYPGLQDITAHVNFSAIIDKCQSLSLERFCSQSHFLLDNGLEEILMNANLTSKEKQGLNTIFSPAEMGEICKCLVLSKNFTVES